ncbi:MAG: methionine ABC transporter permease [Chlamydiota bacterium]
MLIAATLATLYMVFTSGLLALVGGLPLGLFLVFTSKEGLMPRPFLNRSVGSLVNITRSFPFAILIVALIPLTRLIVGTSLGTTAAIVPLTIAAIPFFARLAESSFKEVNPAIIESALTMGATPLQMARYVLIPEALPSLLRNFSNLLISLLGYSTMAGLVGGGGLGKVAVYYGYYQFNIPLMACTVLILIILVESIQGFFNWLGRSINKKRGL